MAGTGSPALWREASSVDWAEERGSPPSGAAPGVAPPQGSHSLRAPGHPAHHPLSSFMNACRGLCGQSGRGTRAHPSPCARQSVGSVSPPVCGSRPVHQRAVAHSVPVGPRGSEPRHPSCICDGGGGRTELASPLPCWGDMTCGGRLRSVGRTAEGHCPSGPLL